MKRLALVQGAAIGFAAGFTLGTVGWGGAQIIKPSLTGIVGISQIAANGCSLASLSVSGTVGAVKFLFEDRVDLSIAASIAVPSVLGARIGVKLAQRLSSEVLALIFNGMSVILIPTHFLVQEYRKNHPHLSSNGDEDAKVEVTPRITPSVLINAIKSDTSFSLNSSNTPSPYYYVQHSLYGICAGVLSALMGVGGAPLTMSYLTLATDLDHHMVQGTMLAAVIPSVLTSAGSLMAGGHTPVLLAAAIACGSSIGSYAGAEFALRLKEEQLRHLYMASLVLLGGRSLLAAAGNVYRLSGQYMKRL